MWGCAGVDGAVLEEVALEAEGLAADVAGEGLLVRVNHGVLLEPWRSWIVKRGRREAGGCGEPLKETNILLQTVHWCTALGG